MKQSLVRSSKIIEKTIAKEFARALTSQAESATESASKKQSDNFDKDNFHNSKKNQFKQLNERFKDYSNYGDRGARILISSSMGVAGVLASRKLRENVRDNVRQGAQDKDSQTDNDTNQSATITSERNELKDYYLKKTRHDYTINNDKLIDIHDKFSEFFDKLDEQPLIKDIMEIASKEDRLNLICLHGEKHPDPEEEHTIAMHDENTKAIHIYNVNNPNITPDFIVSAFVHESGHAVQNILLETKEIYENPFENGSLVSSLREDLYFSGHKKQKDDFESEIDTYPKSEHSYEAHSRYLQELLKNKKVAEEIFPSTTEEVKKIHHNIKEDINKKPKSYTERLEESRFEQLFMSM